MHQGQIEPVSTGFAYQPPNSFGELFIRWAIHSVAYGGLSVNAIKLFTQWGSTEAHKELVKLYKRAKPIP